MATFSEKYVLADFVVGNGVNIEVLEASCKAATFAAKFTGISIDYTLADVVQDVYIWLNAALLTAEKTELDGIIAAHDGTPPPGFDMVW